MRKLSTTRKVLLVIVIILAILQLFGVISFFGEPVVSYSISCGVILMIIYRLFEANQEEKNRFYQ